ncbi:hypothetical protein BCR32DRAFT_225581 [Anaeromyces robustus]|uniref:Conserved oligomeric Golgi complex subunit 5 n=1 Tax=Anaeromyces robustus TaxID=1754192 RepID=A0A1Y1WBX4_9FUNG|nr:hypothetical protein BCR32DRAFT_225581 [Anaeromyces robustus]|eukprot:ORX71060.1 hypothetical protein BCR32DRAFT_225581 [Anaeromyces robustus]
MNNSFQKTIIENPDYQPFMEDSFEPTQYVGMIVQNSQVTFGPTNDISSNIAKLNYSLEYIKKNLFEQVTNNYENLLQQIDNVEMFEDVIKKMQENLMEIFQTYERLKLKISIPYKEMEGHITQLKNIQKAAEILRHLIRFLYLVKRLENQIKSEDREVAKAALSLNEIDMILKESDLSNIDIVDNEVENINTIRKQIVEKADILIEKSFQTQNQSDLAIGLQVYANLDKMSEKVQYLFNSFINDIKTKINEIFNASLLTKETQTRTFSILSGIDSRIANNSKKTTALWNNLESFLDNYYKYYIKVYLIDRVLSRKRNPITHASYNDEITKVLNGNIINVFSKKVSELFDKQLKQSIKTSTYLKQVFQTEYPKLLRSISDFYSRIALFNPEISNDSNIKENLPLIQSIKVFEAVYVSKSQTKLNDCIIKAFTERFQGPVIPSRDDINRIVNTISSEIDLSRFDSHLLEEITHNISKALTVITIKCRQLINNDYQVLPNANSNLCPPTTAQNIDIINSIWWLQENIWKIIDDSSEDILKIELQNPLDEIYNLLCSIVEPLMGNITKQIENIILKIHKEDFNINSKANINITSEGGQCSTYVIELGNYLKWLKREIFNKIKCSELKEWIHSIAARILDFFLRQISIIRSLSENGKLKLASDITTMEFNLNQWFMDCGIKNENDIFIKTQTLKAFKPLLFKNTELLIDPFQTAHIPRTILIQHIFARAPDELMLPHQRFGWTGQHYSEWIDGHNEGELLELLSKCLEAYAEDMKNKGKELCEEYTIISQLIEKYKN